MTLDREVALATEHPRGTERKRLGPYREALVSAAAYAARPESERDAIVRWVEVRRIVKERSGIDHDDANLADPLLPLARLRAHVIEGERLAAGLASADDPGGDLLAAVRSIRSRASGHQPTA